MQQATTRNVTLILMKLITAKRLKDAGLTIVIEILFYVIVIGSVLYFWSLWPLVFLIAAIPISVFWHFSRTQRKQAKLDAERELQFLHDGMPNKDKLS